MKAPSTGMVATSVVALTGMTLVLIGAPHDRKPAPPAAPPSAVAPPDSVTARGFTLTSASMDLPADTAGYPAGPHSDVVNANCTACHSASMALNQPSLTPDQWKATVTKMREVYKAPIADADVNAILGYLNVMPGQQTDAAERTK